MACTLHSHGLARLRLPGMLKDILENMVHARKNVESPKGQVAGKHMTQGHQPAMQHWAAAENDKNRLTPTSPTSDLPDDWVVKRWFVHPLVASFKTFAPYLKAHEQLPFA